MSNKILLGAVAALSIAAFASPSLALDALMMPNNQNPGSPNTPQAAALTATQKGAEQDKAGSFKFSVTGDSRGRSAFAPNSFGPNSDVSNPMGPTPTYGPPVENNDPFFRN
ncbi:MAG TPA: hypothetical protein VL026_08570 [Rhizomicrobium sp.]|nr:hypothetical protein [Rhizomicrobium sp.]